ncbi:MAG: oxidoreductase [Hyphomonadaceae bacterium]
MSAANQIPVESGFHGKSTATEVLEGKSLVGKNAIVTGGYSGIGLETVRALAEAGARVTVPARRVEAAEAALGNIGGDIEIASMDLADLASVKKFAADYAATDRSLHILINNAGIMACPETRVGNNWEAQFGVNHLGHMAMTLDLAPSLMKAEGARLVALSSTAHIRSDVNWDDPHFHNAEYEKWTAYASAKSANALFAIGIDARGEGSGVRAFSVHPGGIFTPLQRHLPEEEMVALGWKNPDGSVPDMIAAMFKTPEQGAATSVWAATSDQLDGKGGVYCEDCDIAKLATEDSQRWEHVREWACDDERAERLWSLSEAMLAEG